MAPTVAVSWQLARQICQCQGVGWDLPVIVDKEEQMFMEARLGAGVRSFFLGYWIPPGSPNPGRSWSVYGDSVYAQNTANTAFTNAFYGLDGSGPLNALPSGNFTPSGVYRHWCEWLNASACVTCACLPADDDQCSAARSTSLNPPSFLHVPQVAPPRLR